MASLRFLYLVWCVLLPYGVLDVPDDDLHGGNLVNGLLEVGLQLPEQLLQMILYVFVKCECYMLDFRNCLMHLSA